MKNENLGTFTLKDNSNGSSWELPVIEGTAGPKVIDVRRLYADTAVSYTHLTLPTILLV